MHARGIAAPVEDWWLKEARELLRGDSRSLHEMSTVLSKHVHREPQFTEPYLSKFTRGKPGGTLTYDLMEALILEYHLARPVQFPRSKPEALAMQRVAKDYDERNKDLPMARQAVLDRASETFEPEKYSDPVKARQRALIQAKLAKGEIAPAGDASPTQKREPAIDTRPSKPQRSPRSSDLPRRKAQ